MKNDCEQKNHFKENDTVEIFLFSTWNIFFSKLSLSMAKYSMLKIEFIYSDGKMVDSHESKIIMKVIS